MLTTPSFRLDGKRALVTGASSGIGQACAVALGEYGADVTLAARNEQGLTETRQMIEAVGGTTAKTMVLDVSKIAECEAWIGEQAPFDILLNSAGMARHTPASETSEADFDQVCIVNFKAAYFLTRAVANRLIKAEKSGSLINISSQMGHIGGIDRSVYSGTKHAVEGMTKSMAIEWGPHAIRVNTICPTFVHTALTAPTFDQPERVEWIKQKIKLGRIGKVEDLMGVTVFLASEASALITGTAILVDGGWTAG